MDPLKLLRDELIYEMRVRGFDNLRGETALSMRRKLRELLDSESFGELHSSDSFCPAPIEEIKLVLTKIEALESYVATKPIVEGSDNLVHVDTKLRHLTARLQRLNIEDNEDNKPTLRAVENLFDRLEKVEELVDAKILDSRSQVLAAVSNPGTSTATSSSSGAGSTIPGVHTVITNVHRQQVEPRKWGISFDGEKSSSISAFLEQVEERRRASNISERDLLAAAVDILQGSALIFYRSIRDNISSWADFKQRFREEFQPFDYHEELLLEIRRRSQGPDEKVGIYFACMKNLFARLPVPLQESEKLNILRRNLHPYFIHNLGLAEYDTVDDLLKLCKRLETNKLTAERCQPPPSRDLLEPDLSCKAVNNPSSSTRPRSRVASVEERKCWSCLKSGHGFRSCRASRTRKFCFGCGAEGVIKRECTRCSGNAVGDGTTGQRR